MTGVARSRFIRKPSLANGAGTNETPVVPFPRSEERFTVFSEIVAVLLDFWPRKTASHVSYLAGVSERAVKYWLAGVTRMSLEHVVALLRTEAGFDILEAMMGDCKVEWWLAAQAAQNIRRSKRAIKKEQERIAATRAQLDLLDQ
jgi:hypothetical protein